MIAWYTHHLISQKIMLSVQRGWKCPAKDTSVFNKNHPAQEAVLYGILRGCSDILHHNFRNNTDYLHIDNGYLKEGHFDGYYRFSLNNTQAVYKDIDLPNDRVKTLKVNLKDWQDNEHGLILILPPTLPVAIFYGIDTKKWINNIIKKIGNRPYKIREKTDPISFEDELKTAKSVVTFNSNAALKAIIEGIPAITLSNHSVLRHWNNLTLDHLDNAFKLSSGLNRDKLLNFVSYHQFTLDECEKGIAPAIIKEMRKENVY
jgi:hypothetical protein